MKIDERLPAAVMVDEERHLQRSRLGEIGDLRCGVDQVPIRVASTRLSEPQNVIRTLLAACQEHGSEVRPRAAYALTLPPRDERILIRLVIEQLRADALLGIRVDGLSGLVDLEVGVELFADECELKEAIGVECVRGHVDASFSVALKERNGASVAMRSDKRMHDDLGENLRVLKPRWRDRLES